MTDVPRLLDDRQAVEVEIAEARADADRRRLEMETAETRLRLLIDRRANIDWHLHHA